MSFWAQHFEKIKKGNTYRKYKDSPISINITTPKRAVLSASMTIEAAFILPLFVFFSVILIYVINLINFQNSVNEKMYDTVRTLSKTEYVTPNSANSLTANLMLIGELGTDAINKMNIPGGSVGIVPLGSDFDGEMINFVIQYKARTPFDVLNILDFSCVQKTCVRKWIGNSDEGDGGNGTTGTEDVLVYVTETGTVYHTNRECTYLRLSIQSVESAQVSALRNIGGGKYYACELCGQAEINRICYITDTGDRFHNNINCSGLKRSILTIPLNAVGDKTLCSRCGK